MNDKSKFDSWAILEVMGHHKFAGKVSEQTVGGAAFVRIDVPELDGRPAFTKLFGGSSIYCITPVTEEVARHVARSLMQTPVNVWDLPEDLRNKIRSLPAPSTVPDDDDEYYDDLP